jgi:hypothetical protein
VPAPAELDEELAVARFVLAGYTPGCRVEAQPGTFIDLALPDGFALTTPPTHPSAGSTS